LRRNIRGLAIAAGNDADLEQAALQRPVEQGCLAARLEADQFGQTQVGCEKKQFQPAQ